MRGVAKRVVGFLREDASEVNSLLDRNLDTWLLQLRTHLVAKGEYRATPFSALVRYAPDGVKAYIREDVTLRLFRQLYGMVAEELDPRDEYDKEVWNLRRLGIAGRASATINYLNFTHIGQPWLKEAIKRYCQYTLVRGAPSSCHEWIVVANQFSRYLAEAYPHLNAGELRREVMLRFAPFLERAGYSRNRRYSALIHLRTVLEHCGREGWGGVPNRALLYKEDLPARTAAIPRFIPDEVVRALNAHLDDLPEDQQRMLLVIQEVGMRGGELCEAPFDCLIHDNEGDYFFLYYQGKMRKEHHVPISRELALAIKEQQAHVRERVPDASLRYLFMTRRGEPYQRGSLAPIINSLARKHDIRGTDGQPFWFRSHGFRHRVGTSMINNGVPQHIVQRFLGHESPQMTSVYAHIMDSTLKRAIEEYRARKVGISGAVVPDTGAAVPEDALVLKRNVQAQALPNGQCHLPVQAGPCPHANACLTCGHFRSTARFLPVLKQQLADAERMMEWAKDNDAGRVLEMNERVAANLRKMIAALEGESTLIEISQVVASR
jgi:integrase